MTEFQEIARNLGVDSLPGKPAHIIVPKDGHNFLRLANGAGYKLKATKGTDKVSITKVDRDDYKKLLGAIAAASILQTDVVYRIKGLKGGEGAIEAKGSAGGTTITFSVHPKKLATLSIFFIADEQASGGPKKRSRFDVTDADKWIAYANEVFGPQANVWFEKGHVRLLGVKDLEAVVTPASEAKFIDLPDAKPPADGKTKRLNVRAFAAGDKIDSGESTHPLGYFSRKSKIIVLKDQPTPTAESKDKSSLPKTLCHEIAHFLNDSRGGIGAGHGVYFKLWSGSDILDTMDEGNVKIPRQRVYDWNPW